MGKLENASIEIYKALGGLSSGESIALLESIKFDIILNDGIVKINGKVGLRKCRKHNLRGKRKK